MPLTVFQKTVLRLLAANRSPDSYVAGGTAINRADKSIRFSRDIDLFHAAIEAVQASADADVKLLKKKHYDVEYALQQRGFIRAIVSKGKESVKLEWVTDTAFRFFPILKDPEVGYRLHDADLATNKCLALANRTELRDVLDLVQFDENYLSLASIVWAACGKDPGFTPDLLLDCLQRNSRIRPDLLAAEACAAPIDARELKLTWNVILGRAQSMVAEFPAGDLGCLYLDRAGEPVKAPSPAELISYTRHFGSIGGAWPSVYN